LEFQKQTRAEPKKLGEHPPRKNGWEMRRGKSEEGEKGDQKKSHPSNQNDAKKYWCNSKRSARSRRYSSDGDRVALTLRQSRKGTGAILGKGGSSVASEIGGEL